jgi:PilZ domain
MRDRRSRKRTPRRRAAWIIGEAGEKIACLLANVSDDGARLDLLGSDQLPQEFTLCLEEGTRRARIVWHKRWHLGVRFVSAEGRVAA